MTIQELLEKRGKVWGQMQDVARRLKETRMEPDKPAPALTTDEQRQWDAWDKEYNDLTNQIKVLELDEKRAAEAAAREGQRKTEEKPTHRVKASFAERRVVWQKVNGDPLNSRVQKVPFEQLSQREKDIYANEERRSQVMDKWGKFSYNALGKDEQEVMEEMIGESDYSPEKRALGLTSSAGGYSIGQAFMAELERTMLYYGPMLQAARVIRTPTGATMPWPTTNDTGNSGRLLSEAGDASSGTTDPTFNVVNFTAYNYTSDLIKVARVLLQDSALPFESILSDMLGERLGRILNTHATTGDNSSKPQGVTAGAGFGKVSASASAITFAEVIAFKHSVDRAYRGRPQTAFMMHDGILSQLKQLSVQTGFNVPLWQPGYVAGAPDTIDGDRYWINNDMVSSYGSSGAKIMLYGDFSKYVIRLVSDIEIMRLAERYAELHQVAFVGFMRFDARILNSSAIKYFDLT